MSSPTPDPLSVDYLLGMLTERSEHHERRITQGERDTRTLKAEVDRLKTWAERAALLVVIYASAIGFNAKAEWLGETAAQIVLGLLRRG